MSQQAERNGREPETVPPVRLSRWTARGRLALLIPLVVAVLVASLVFLGLHQGSRRAGHTSAGKSAGTTDVSAVLGVLGRHASALTERNAQVWSADLDKSAGAAGYAGRERRVFTNLAQVPLSTWRYVLVAPVTDPNVLRPAATRLGGEVVIVHVELQYAFADVDPAPTGKQLWITAVSRDAGWKLAGDDDAAAAGGPSWRGPWDFGPLLARHGRHTLVLAHPAHRSDLQRFAGLIDNLVPVVSSVWGPDWNDNVGVLIPDSQPEFAAVTGDSADSHDLAAVSVADQVSPDGAVLGARIVLNPANLSRLDATGRRLVIGHELTHIASRAATSDQMPAWLIEGLADYVGNLNSGLPVAGIAAELAVEVRAGRVPTGLPTGADFGASGRSSQAYEQSWLACRLIAARVGRAGLVRFYKAVAAAARVDPATAAAVGLRQVLHTTLAAFTADWRAYLIGQLR